MSDAAIKAALPAIAYAEAEAGNRRRPADPVHAAMG